MSQGFSVTFWGVRGSIASPGPSTQRYGGNTPCLEVTCGDRTIVVDAGTGLRPLGDKLARQGPNQELDVFFTHTHMDHFVGLPFFAVSANAPLLQAWFARTDLPPSWTEARASLAEAWNPGLALRWEAALAETYGWLVWNTSSPARPTDSAYGPWNMLLIFGSAAASRAR